MFDGGVIRLMYIHASNVCVAVEVPYKFLISSKILLHWTVISLNSYDTARHANPILSPNISNLLTFLLLWFNFTFNLTFLKTSWKVAL